MDRQGRSSQPSSPALVPRPARDGSLPSREYRRGAAGIQDGAAHGRLAACCARLGLAEEAAAEARTVLAALLDFSARTFVDQMVLLERAEDRDLLLQDMLKAGLPG